RRRRRGDRERPRLGVRRRWHRGARRRPRARELARTPSGPGGADGDASRRDEAPDLSPRAHRDPRMTACTNARMSIPRLPRALFLCLAAWASRPVDSGMVNATIEGRVFVTGPVAGVVVSAYALDMSDGARGDLVATSTPTDESGAYHMDLGSFHG